MLDQDNLTVSELRKLIIESRPDFFNTEACVIATENYAQELEVFNYATSVFFPVRTCSLCDYHCGYLISSCLIVAYDSGCYCVSYRRIELSDFNSMHTFYA